MTTPDLSGPPQVVARRLLGCRLWTDIGGRTEIILTEVEAYGGHDDPASHAYRGRTARNGSMFGPAGTLYVYRSYGIHWCANVATGPSGQGQAVLLRGGLVVDGEEMIRKRRGRADHLTDGPGKLTEALGITGGHDGTNVADGPVRIEGGDPVDAADIRTSTRVGITKEASRLWRFVLDIGGSEPGG